MTEQPPNVSSEAVKDRASGPRPTTKVWVVHSVTFALLAIGVLAGYRAGILGDPVARRNFDRLAPGMTELEVEAVLGNWQEPCRFASARWPQKGGDAFEWMGDEYTIVVWFDEAGRLVDKADFRWTPTKSWEAQSMDERLLRFFRLESGRPRWIRWLLGELQQAEDCRRRNTTRASPVETGPHRPRG